MVYAVQNYMILPHHIMNTSYHIMVIADITYVISRSYNPLHIVIYASLCIVSRDYIMSYHDIAILCR